MFEGVVADLLNKYLGKYVQNLDPDNLNVGIFSGEVELTDLQLKPEALFELDLPIEVKAGHIGHIQLSIPWTSIYSSPVVVVLEDVYILAGPIADRKYDAGREKALLLARKRARLAGLETSTATTTDESSEKKGFTERLTATIVNNLQVSIKRIHIRYEDKITNPDHPFACGIMLKELTAETTNSQWQAMQLDASALLVHKLVRLQELSVYWNPYLPDSSLVRSKIHADGWKNLLKNSITSHRITDEDFDFILRPVAGNAKLIFNKEEESVLPKLTLDFALGDIEMLVSRQQFLNALSLSESLVLMDVNQRYRRYSPGVPFKGHIPQWWHYAYKSVVEEYIRPYSWQRIKQHRQWYKEYKDLYKQHLKNRQSAKIQRQLGSLEEKLDVANIVLAREHAKLEYAQEAPTEVTRRKPGQGWFSWAFGGGGGDEDEDPDEGEVVIHRPNNLPEWLEHLTPEQRDKLFKNIGYDENRNVEHAPQYVAHKLSMNLKSFTVSLVNYGKEVLKATVTQVQAHLAHRPESEGIKVTARTDTFIVEGLSVEHDLLPVITSDIGVYAPSITNQVFSVELEKSPVHVQADYAAVLKIQPVEIIYDEHALTEVIAFFQMPNITAGDVRSKMAAGWTKIANISRAGMQHAISQHKTVHLSAHMKSPYIVIPEYGALHRGGNVLVIDFGKLKIESELQPKHMNLEDLTMSEIEARLYDKFNITVSDVKALVADSGDDWHTAQTKQDSEFHVLPSFGMNIAFFNTVKSEYKQLPRHKIEARLSTLKLNLSDEKILVISDFYKHMPMPHSNSMMGMDDSVDGHILEPVLPILDEKEVQVDPTKEELKNMKKSVHRNSVVRRKHKPGATYRDNRKLTLSTESEHYYSASDHSDEEVDDWAKGLDLSSVDDHSSATNLITVLGRFKLGEVVIQVSKSADKIDTPYLMLRIDRLCTDVSMTTYGMAMQASLGGIQLVDKIHLGSSGEYMEVLGSKSDSDLISLKYRRVDPSCPDFVTMYHGIEQAMIAKLSSLRIMFDRAAILYLNTFIQGLLINVQGSMGEHSLRKSTSTVLSGPTTEAARSHMEPPSFIDRLTSKEDDMTNGSTKLHLVAKLDSLDLKLCDHENEFAEVQVKGVEGRVIVKTKTSTIQARLTDLLIEDLTENTLYRQVLTIEDDNAFDFKMVTYSDSHSKMGSEKRESVDGSIKMRLGRVHGVFLYKFMSEMQNFMEPFTNPDLLDAYKVAAQQAVHTKIQDVQEQGTRISLYLDIRAPTILVPQHSESTNIMMVKLGDLSLKNFFEDSEIGGGVLQHWDHMYLSLDSVQVIRGKLTLGGSVEHCHTVIEPLSFKTDLKRALPPYHSELHYDVTGELKTIRVQLTEVDVKVIMAIIRENLQEVSSKPEKVDEADMTPMTDRPLPILPQESLDTTTTPIVEIEEPLLAAPEVLELVRQTKAQFVMEGVELTLLRETEDGDQGELLATTPSKDETDESDGLARFEVGQLAVGGTLSSEGELNLQCTLQSITMTDIRPDSELAVKRMLQSTQPGVVRADAPPMIYIDYKYSPEGTKQADVNIETLRVNLCMEYLMMVQQFFSRALKTAEDNLDIRPANGSPTSPTSRSFPRPPSLGNSAYPPAAQELSNSTKVLGTFKQLEIVLFAEPTQRHSRVLVLKANGGCDYFRLQDREHLDAKVRQLQIVSCLYGLASKTASMVLHPCDLEFTRDRESFDNELKMEAKLSDIFLHLSATNVHILLDVLDIIRQNKAVPVSTHDTSLGSAQHYDLWKTQKISTEPWLQPEPDDTEDHFLLSGPDRVSESLSVDMKKIQIMFEVENLDYHVPRLCVKASMEAELKDWSKQLIARGEIQLEASYYKEKLAAWEPLIEPIMENEGNYRPWEVLVKCVQAASHPISCSEMDYNLNQDDEVDNDVHLLMTRARDKSDSSETETDSDTEMTIIRPKPVRKVRQGSHSSYDSVSHVTSSSIQGESDSEPELISTISSNLDSMFTSDSSEADLSEGDDDAFDNSDKPVFLTAKGPVHVETEKESGYDETDAPYEEDFGKLCSYWLIDSHDQLLVNLTPTAIDIITEVAETFMRKNTNTMKSIHDLPGFEIFNELDVAATVSISHDLKNITVEGHWAPTKPPPVMFTAGLQSPPPTALINAPEVFEDNLHKVSLASTTTRRPPDEVDNTAQLIDIDVDEDSVDGLSFLQRALGGAAHTLVSSGAFVFGEEEEDQYYINNKDLGKEKMHIKMGSFDEIYNVSHRKAVSKLVPLAPCRNDTNYCFVYDVDVTHGRKVVTLKSPLQLHNHLTVPVDVCVQKSELEQYSISNQYTVCAQNNKLIKLRTVQPGELYYIPLFVAYHCKLYISLCELGYGTTTHALWWQDLSVAKDRHKFFACLPSSREQTKPFFFKALCTDGAITSKGGNLPKVIPHYSLHLYPPVTLHNLLPYDVQFAVEGKELDTLTHGENMPLYNADLAGTPKLRFKVQDYLNTDWSGSFDLTFDLEEFKAIAMDPEVNIEGQSKQLSLGVHVKRGQSLDLFVYSPYWIVNKTGLDIQIRGSRSEAVYQNDSSTDPLLFRFKKHRRKKAKLKVYNSKWTRSFSLDTVGSNGVVVCQDKERNRKYQFLLQIQMSKLHLTKIVTIMPYFLVINNTPHPLRYMEENEEADLWMDIGIQQCEPFWPSTDSMKLYMKYKDSKVSSQHFYIHRPHKTTLRMDKGTALCVEVAGGMESPITVTFLPYEHGDAPVRVENLCEDVFIKLHQKNQSQVSLLSPCQSVLYTWDDPTSERTLMWNVYNRKKPSYPAFITKDGCGEVQLSIQTVRRSSMLRAASRTEPPSVSAVPKHAESSDDDDSEAEVAPKSSPMLRSTRTDKVIVYWVSFLDGLQRVILFTQDQRIARRARKMMEAEHAESAVFLSLGGIGVSLINGVDEEVAFMTVSCGAALWEVEVKNKWKTLNMELASLLEEKWLQDDTKVALEDYLEANLEEMEMKKPFMGSIRRVYNPALWLQYRRSIHHTYVHGKIHRLQIDNQLRDAYFPTVFYPSPLPSYILKKSGPKPFLEFAVMRRQVPENNVDTFKYVKVLLQEFNLKLDKGFALSVYDILESRYQKKKESEQLQADLTQIHRTLQDLTSAQAAARTQRVIFEYLHLSPLKMRISFSLDGRVHRSHPLTEMSFSSDLINFFLNSVGATFTEISEVEIRMAYFERQGALLSPDQLFAEIMSHYKTQAVQQAYVFVLGLDVLGNPYSLIKDFTQGLGDFFYEPFLSTIHSPDKFADNLVKGVHSLMEHTVGSTAGSISMITGSLGRTLALLSFDKDYKKRRRQRLQQQPKNLPKSLAVAAKGFVMGVALGISGVVMSPIRGVQEEGVEGFFKGIGKGLMGLLTKPTGGAIDMVSMAFDGIRRAAEMGEDIVVRMRPPRYINPSLGVKPYSRYQAVGMRILNNIEKEKYANTDVYWAHAALSPDERADVALITNKHIILLAKCRIWGDWDVEWEVDLADIIGVPAVTENKLVFKVNRDDSGFSIFTSDQREISGTDEQVLHWLQRKIEKIMNFGE